MPWWLAPLFVAAGVALAALLVSTGVTLARRSAAAEVFASMAGAFLICDAWFDVTTAYDRATFVMAAIEAVFAELPLAIACLWIARNIERVLADGRPLREIVRLRPAALDEGHQSELSREAA